MSDAIFRTRTLARVVAVDNDGVWVTLPGWNSRLAVLWAKDLFPQVPAVDYRFHVNVNLKTDDADELDPQNFEWLTAEEQGPDPNDGLGV